MAHEITQEHKSRFLELLRKTGNVSVSSRAIGFGPSTMKRHRELDDQFNLDWQEAEDEAADALEAEARRRAHDGVLRERCIGSGVNAKFVEELQYSDTLLLALLKAERPDKFADRSKTELSNPDGKLSPVIGDTDLAARLSSFLALAAQRMKDEANG